MLDSGSSPLQGVSPGHFTVWGWRPLEPLRLSSEDSVVMGVEAVANSKIGGHKVRGISGGERRRAAVGVGDLLAKLIPVASTVLC